MVTLRQEQMVTPYCGGPLLVILQVLHSLLHGLTTVVQLTAPLNIVKVLGDHLIICQELVLPEVKKRVHLLQIEQYLFLDEVSDGVILCQTLYTLVYRVDGHKIFSLREPLDST